MKSLNPDKLNLPRETPWELRSTCRWSKYLTRVESSMLENVLSSWNSPDAALDIGCDGGRWSRLLIDQGWRVSGVDVREDAIEKCQMRHPDAKFTLIDEATTTYPFPDDSFRVVVAIQVPITHHEWFATEIHRILKPGGIAIFTIFNRASYRYLLTIVRSVLKRDPDYCYRSSFYSLKRMYESKGLSFANTCGYAWLPLGRESNSPLIGPLTAIESRLGMHRLTWFAPWVCVAAQKVS